MNINKTVISSPERRLQIGKLIIDRVATKLYLDDEEILTPFKTIRVLEILACNKDCIVSREQLINDIWGENFLIGDKSLTTAIWQIRNEIIKTYDTGVSITTIPRQGYKLNLDEANNTEKEQQKSEVNNSGHQVRSGSNTKIYLYYLLLAVLAIVIAVTTFLFISQNEDSIIAKSTAATIPIPLTHTAELEYSPVISPDGNSVVYALLSADGKSSIQIAASSRPYNSTANQVYASDNTTIGGLDWSPDGQSISFLQRENSTNNCKLVVLNMINKSAIKLAECLFGISPVTRWSSDGFHIAYLGPNKKSGLNNALKVIEFDTQKSMNIIKQSSTQLPLAFDWHPVSNQLIVGYRDTNKRNKGHLKLIDTDGTENEFLELDGVPINIQWTQNYIYITSVMNDTNSRILKIDSASKQTESLVLPNKTPSDFSISNDEKKASYNAVNVNYKVIQTTRAEYPNMTSISSGIDGAKSPHYSQTSKVILFDSTLGNDDAIWKYLPETKEKILLDTKHLDGINSHPESSLDDTYISIIGRKPDGCWYISINSSETLKTIQRVESCNRIYSVEWALDSKNIYYCEVNKGVHSIWKYHLATKTKTKILSNAGAKLQAYKKHLFYVDLNTRELKTLSLDKKAAKSKLIQSENFKITARDIWYVIDNTVYIMTKLSGITKLHSFSFDGTAIKTVKLLNSSNQSLPSFQMTSTDEFIATMVEFESDIQLLVLQ